MTKITHAEAAEILWASSEQGEAAIKAACDQARSFGVLMTGAHLTESDVSGIVYAAYLAAGWDAEPMEDGDVPVHDHHWTVLGAQPHTPPVLFGKPIPHTIVLIRCTACGEPNSRILPGEWTMEDLRGSPAE
jgi:hypothetical protein